MKSSLASLLAIGPMVACSGASPPNKTMESGSTLTILEPVYRATWTADGGAAPTVILMDIDEFEPAMTVTGEDCTPSVVLFGVSFNDEGPDIQYNLYFDGPLEPGQVTALPLAEPTSPKGQTEPLQITTKNPYDAHRFVGGEVRVIAVESARWEFRFEGEGLSSCAGPVAGVWTCEPFAGGTLVFEPVDPSGTLPPPTGSCIEGEAFPWPDGWDGCGAATGGEVLTECPTTVSW